MSRHQDEQLVAAVIQRMYGDATQTVLDRNAARDIIAELRAHGWLSGSEVATLIEAAGGRIVIAERALVEDPDYVVRRWADPASSTVTLDVRRG